MGLPAPFNPNCVTLRASLIAQMVKNPPAMRETWVRSLGWEDPLEKGKATHSSILAWRIPWTTVLIRKRWTQLSDFHLVHIQTKKICSLIILVLVRLAARTKYACLITRETNKTVQAA